MLITSAILQRLFKFWDLKKKLEINLLFKWVKSWLDYDTNNISNKIDKLKT